MAKDFNKGWDTISSMIDDEPAEDIKKAKQKEKTVTFAFRTTQKIADMIRSYAYYENKSVRAVMEELVAEKLSGVDLPKRKDEEEN
nr:MAG TPA: repressor [Caudoviricetes sp.]